MTQILSTRFQDRDGWSGVGPSVKRYLPVAGKSLSRFSSRSGQSSMSLMRVRRFFLPGRKCAAGC